MLVFLCHDALRKKDAALYCFKRRAAPVIQLKINLLYHYDTAPRKTDCAEIHHWLHFGLLAFIKALMLFMLQFRDKLERERSRHLISTFVISTNATQ